MVVELEILSGQGWHLVELIRLPKSLPFETSRQVQHKLLTTTILVKMLATIKS